MPDEFIFAKILGRDVTIAPQERAPMFVVNIQTGQVTLNRMKEALGYDFSSR